MEATVAPQLNRVDRHVGRSYVRMSEGASRVRVAYSLEEALRLASLPGEDEGRIYCFRRVSLCSIPASANRSLWTDQVQQALTAVASRAVRGDLSNAGASDAIYFNSLEDALETLLRGALRHGKTESATPPWFSASLLGVEAGATYSIQIPVILQQLKPPAIAPGAAAAILFAALSGNDAAELLEAVPSATVREWVRELEGPKGLDADAPRIGLPVKIENAIRQTASQFGWGDPATVWLAAEAVICISPGSWSAGTEVRRARTILRSLEAERASKSMTPTTPHRDAAVRPLVFDDEDATPSMSRPPLAEMLATPRPEERPEPFDQISMPRRTSKSDRISDLQISAIQDTHIADLPVTWMATIPLPLGEVTEAAGLFFLLNALRRVGIVAALEACPALAESGLLTEIMMRLGACAGVAEDDSILSCLIPTQVPFVLPSDAVDPSKAIWPHGFVPSPRADFDTDYLVRAWVVAVKRWCWRTGRITVGNVVGRNGQVWRTRTDLDVTLPLSAVDIRIRRIGLDIDPGWLPWFGQCGCVVRFHYSDQKSGSHSC